MTCKKNIICITCPKGCNMTVEKRNGEIISIKGNSCKKGYDYALDECTNPKRILTTTVKIEGGMLPLIPVKTNKPIPKDEIMNCMEKINTVCIKAPAAAGETVIENICKTGADIITTRSMEAV